ncbi:hypothetical protein [Marinobacter sp.]|uniref:hypothetical protein n=1 Tax=Marinobacter sp. TaxID=50741 RepID=UPI003F9DA8F3
MKKLHEVAENLRATTGALVAITELYEDLIVDFESNADAPGYISGFHLGGLNRAIIVVAKSAAEDSDYLAEKIGSLEGQK